MTPISIKTPEEIELMRKGGRILSEMLDLVVKTIRPGMSSAELDRVAETFVRSHEGALPAFKGYRGFPGTLCISINEEVVHGIPRPDVFFEEGDVVGLDGGVLLGRLYTDACRTVILGTVPANVRHFVQTTDEALKRAVKVVRPGARVGDISHVIQETLERHQYAPVIECTGHGVGYHLHEEPEILNAGRSGTGPVLSAGMVLAIEPIATMGTGEVFTADDHWTIISADGSLSAHFEHTVLVTPAGHEILA